MKIQFKDLGKIVEVPDGASDEYIDDVYDDLAHSLSTGEVPKIEKSQNVLIRAAKGLKEFSDQAQYGFTNTATFGLPNLLEKKTGFKMSPGEPKGMAGNIGRAAGDIGGFVGGGPEQLAGKGALKFLPKAGKFTKGAAKLGASTASLSPASMASGDSSMGQEAAKVAGGAALGGALEAVPNVLMKAGFRKNIKREKLDGLLKDIGKTKGQVKDSGQTYDATNLLDQLTKISDEMAPAVRNKATELNRWITDLKSRTQSTILGKSGKPVSKPPIMTADELRQMEAELGSFAKFGGTKGGFAQFVKPSSPVANEATKSARTAASGEYDKIAGPEFATKSKKVSSILKRYPDLDPSKGRNDFGQRVAGSIAATAMSGNPLVGFGTYVLQKLSGLPEIKQATYKALGNPLTKAAGRGAKEVARGAYGSS
jgi:hypothetical protein